MEIMSLLDRDGMNRLRADFEAKPDGLSLDEFVGTLLIRLPDTGESDVDLVAKLQDLFQQVDVNGDGTMEWEEFSEFCIEAGIAASHMSGLEVTEKYMQRRHEISTSREVNQVFYVPQLQRLFLCESGSRFLQVYDPHYQLGRRPSALNSSGGVSSFENDSSDASNALEQQLKHVHNIDLIDSLNERSNDGNHGAVLTMAYIELNNRKMLAISSTNMSITFWDAGIYEMNEAVGSGVPRFLHRHQVDKPQFFLEWAPHMNALLSAAAESTVNVFEIGFNPELWIQESCSLKKHVDLIQDILAIPDLGLVATAGLDAKIYLWGTDEEGSDETSLDKRIMCKSERSGHIKGIRSLAYADDGLLLSAAFDLVVFGWDITGLSLRPVFQLKGHTEPLFCVRVLPSKQHAATIDISGIIKTWDIRREGSVMDSERGIQTFTAAPIGGGGAGDEKSEEDSAFSPRAMSVLHPSGSIVVAKKRVVTFDSVSLQPEKFSPAACLYNPISMTIAAAIHRDVKVWDALSGTLTCHFQNIVPTDITNMCFDFRLRKFITSDQSGGVGVFNYLNGAVMKDNSFNPHHGEVACMKYDAQDKVLVSSGWDKVLRVYDETHPSRVPELRKVVGAHKADTTGIALSHDLSLIATCDDTGIIRLWDFQFLTLEGQMVLPTGVVALEFLDPYPLLATVDRSGLVRLWVVRPFPSTAKLYRNSCVAKFEVFESFDEEEDSITQFQIHHRFLEATAVPTTSASTQGAIDAKMPGEKSKEKPMPVTRRTTMYLGTGSGSVGVYDLTDTIKSLKIAPIAPAQMLHSRENYSPYRKLTKHFNADDSQCEQHQGSPRSANSSKFGFVEMLLPRVSQPVPLSAFQAHNGTIASLQVLDDPDAILTCSSDTSIRLWKPNGTRLGELDSNERKALAVGLVHKTWHFPVDLKSRRARELAGAETLVKRIISATTSHEASIASDAVISPADREKLERVEWEHTERVSILQQFEGHRRQLSELLAFEDELKSLHAQKQQEELNKRRDERKLRAAHVRELNNIQDDDESSEPESKNDDEQQSSGEAGEGDKEFSVLAAVVAGASDGIDLKERERERLLGQLEGQVTWVKTQQELAAEAAAAIEKQRQKGLKKFSADPLKAKKGKRKKKGKSTAKKKGKANQGMKSGEARKSNAHQKNGDESAPGSQKAENVPSPKGGAIAPQDPQNGTEKSKNFLYSNLQVELNRIETAKTERMKLVEEKVDTCPPALVKEQMDRLRQAQRLSKRHSQSAPLLDLKSAPQNATTSRFQARIMRGLSWKFVADKVKNELEADLALHTPKVKTSRSTRHISPLRARKSANMRNSIFKAQQDRNGSRSRLTRLSTTLSIDQIFARTPKFDDSESDSDDMIAEEESFTSISEHGSLLSSDGSSIPRSGHAEESVEILCRAPELSQEELDERKFRAMQRRKQKEQQLEEANKKLLAMREKLSDRKAAIAQQMQATQERKLKARRARENEVVRRRVTKANLVVSKAFDPTQEQLKRIRNTRYFGPYPRQDVAHIRSVFHSIDTDGTGTIEIHEFQREIKQTSSESGNFRSLLDDSVSMFNSIDTDHSGTIQVDELARVLFRLATAQEMDDIIIFLKMGSIQAGRRTSILGTPKRSSESVAQESAKSTRNFRAEIHALFNLYDVDRDGKLTLVEMQDAIDRNSLLFDHQSTGIYSEMDRGLSERDIETFVKQIDTDNDGHVSFEEFYEWFIDKWS